MEAVEEETAPALTQLLGEAGEDTLTAVEEEASEGEPADAETDDAPGAADSVAAASGACPAVPGAGRSPPACSGFR